MDTIDHYFWFISGAVALLNVLIWRRRLNRLVARGRISEAEANAFLRGAAIAIGAASLSLGTIALVVPASPRCLRPFDFSDPGSGATSVVILLLWAALLRWVWGGGGDFIARAPAAFVNTATDDTEYSPAAVRLVVTALVIASGVGVFLVTRGMPAFPGCVG